uniref:Uncharacterized protein n=1 Tax=Utricularia reniformis TaxID=192314 RepID=A0A1Y0B2E4_9LAMI|nr:hypothetical protein AEK19_MT1366 [Utricularia reniformis]ART31564.1 hypothetical protein AEK19_MT1366 [Utricularia reniformis]
MFQQSIVCHDYSTLSKVLLDNCRQTGVLSTLLIH